MSGHTTPKTVAIIGAGASGLMVADVLSQYNVRVEVYEQMPSAGRKILWAGKTGLNITHSEPMTSFVQRYTPSGWLDTFLNRYDNRWLVRWFDELGIQTFVGSSGRVFPVQMKASVFLRAWLGRLHERGVRFCYRHRCVFIKDNVIGFEVKNKDDITTVERQFDVIVLACGGGSYQRLGSDGAWQAWFVKGELNPLHASNVGVVRSWSPFMQAYFGQALKNVSLWVGNEPARRGDVIISHYGMESGLIYQANKAMRQGQDKDGNILFYLDLLPQKSLDELIKFAQKSPKLSLNTLLKKLGLSPIKIALVRECTPKSDWQDTPKMLSHIKGLAVACVGFRPIDEAISTGGGVRQDALGVNLQLKSNRYVFCCGEMLDFDAPTGGYLLTACFATGQVVGQAVADCLDLVKFG